MNQFIDSTLGDYRINALIGEGATGQVYRGTHILRGNVVAIKILRQQNRKPEFNTRFFEQAQALTPLKHPNLNKVYHYGYDLDTYYIVMDLAKDGSVESLLSDPPITQWNSSYWPNVELIVQAAEGLSALHSKGIVHGGIKPGNLLLSRGDSGTTVKLTDIGITLLLSELSASKNSGLETSLYACPEQRQGLRLDQRSDLYCLGAVLYELMTRRAVFRAQAAAGGATITTISAPRQFVSQFPDELETIIMRCLAPEPKERFAAASDVATALRAVLDKAAYSHQPKNVTPFPSHTSPSHTNPSHTNGAALPYAVSPPPTPPTKGVVPNVPSIQLIDGNGESLGIQYLTGAGVTIGSDPDNEIILKGPQISEKHVRIEWDGRHVTITDLGSAAGTFQDGRIRLMPQLAQEWTAQKWFRIGTNWLWLEFLRDDGLPGGGPAAVIDVLLGQGGREMTLIPGKQAVCRVTLVNNKTQVDHAFITVEGMPEEWIEGDNRDTYLQPFEKRELELTINIPKAPSSRAGDYKVRIRANSRAHPTIEQGVAVASWTVMAFDQMYLQVTPSKVYARRQGQCSVTIHHEGNLQANCSLTGFDGEKQLEFAFSTDRIKDRSQLQLDLQPGTTTPIKLKLNAARRWVGSPTQHPFTVQAVTGEGKPPHTGEGQFFHKPLFSTWMLAVAPVLLIAIAFLAVYWGKPLTPRVSVEPRDPIVGQPVELRWETPRATQVEVLLNDLAVQNLDPEAGKYGFPKGFEKDARIKIVGSNIFGTAEKSITIAVKAKPPDAAPEIQLNVSAMEITQGQSVTISWNIKGASKADFNLKGDVSMRDSFTDTPSANQTYTITAVNKDNVESKQSRTVTVKAPTVRVGQVAFSASTMKSRVGDTIVFTWAAPNAQAVRIDAVIPTQLTGASGQKPVTFKGKGLYQFTLVATDATNNEIRSKPIQINVDCPLRGKIPIFGKCSNTLDLQWK